MNGGEYSSNYQLHISALRKILFCILLCLIVWRGWTKLYLLSLYDDPSILLKFFIETHPPVQILRKMLIQVRNIKQILTKEQQYYAPLQEIFLGLITPPLIRPPANNHKRRCIRNFVVIKYFLKMLFALFSLELDFFYQYSDIFFLYLPIFRPILFLPILRYSTPISPP